MIADKAPAPTEGVDDLVASGWQPIRRSAFTRLVGPILHRRDGEIIRFCFRAEAKHDNAGGRVHGGMIMSFCDEALGLTAHMRRPGERLVTIGFDCQFIDASVVGELIEIEPQVTRQTSSLMFMRGNCMVGERIVASCSGIWKAFKQRAKDGNG